LSFPFHFDSLLLEAPFSAGLCPPRLGEEEGEGTGEVEGESSPLLPFVSTLRCEVVNDRNFENCNTKTNVRQYKKKQ